MSTIRLTPLILKKAARDGGFSDYLTINLQIIVIFKLIADDIFPVIFQVIFDYLVVG
jgi:hypothetical protein